MKPPATPLLRVPATHFRWAIVGLLCAVAFVLYVDRINILVAAPYLASEFGLSTKALGEVLSAFLFGYAFGLVPGGWLADRFGPRNVLTAACMSWGLITLSTAMIHRHAGGRAVNAVALLESLRFLLGLCEACAYPTFARALANWMRRSERARASGLIHAASGFGGAFTLLFPPRSLPAPVAIPAGAQPVGLSPDGASRSPPITSGSARHPEQHRFGSRFFLSRRLAVRCSASVLGGCHRHHAQGHRHPRGIHEWLGKSRRGHWYRGISLDGEPHGLGWRAGSGGGNRFDLRPPLAAD